MPERIKVDNIIYRYENWEHFYYTDNEAREDLLVRGKDYSTNDFLNWNVEIIEEQQDIDIQELKERGQFCNLAGLTENEEILWEMIQCNANTINETVKALKQLDRKINKE